MISESGVGGGATRRGAASASTTIIQVEGLRKRFGACTALDDVSFEVARGEIVGLLGPNGAGKTTCLRILTCFIAPDAGKVRIDGLDPEASSVEVRRRIGYLPEGAPSYPELRVQETLDYRARLKQIPRAKRATAIARVVEACGLGEVRSRPVGQLSHGFRRRLGLADALLGEPALLVLDEPTVGLDPNQIRELREVIRALGGAHTVLLSTHVLSEVEAVCTRALVLHRGRVVAQGEVAGLRAGGDRWCRVTARLGAGEGPDELLSALRGVEGVQGVELLPSASGEASTARCQLAAEAEGAVTCEALAARVLDRGWCLRELTPEDPSLEQVFAQLTTERQEGRGGR
jgi:gliding motility-associated transport system ATP-binding protein